MQPATLSQPAEKTMSQTALQWDEILGTDKTFVIAEAGVNHNGNLSMAKELVDAAIEAKADAVKFQLFNPDTLASKQTPLAAYQAETLSDQKTKTQHDLLASLTLPEEAYKELQAYAAQRGIMFLCTPFDEVAAQYLHHDLQLPMLKIPSGEVTNLPFLRMLGRMNTPIILSTGMSTLAEVQAAEAALRQENPDLPLSLLHCVSSYPTTPDSVNLRALQTLDQAFPNCLIGYSDHTLGWNVTVAAVALGARIIEKHYTLDKDLPGPDHKMSLTAAELKAMMQAIREVESALGDGVKQPQPIEGDCIAKARKSLIIRKDLPAGHQLSLNDLAIKRPGTGISPAQLEAVIGKTLTLPMAEDSVLHWEHLR